jgi:hypothetical protein
MTAAQFEMLADIEAEEVLRWRFDLLVRAGYEAGDAMVIATHVEVDLHLAEDLVRAGCPPTTAVQILL